jgi:demethylmenaquinone methyltransferase / 2-methoxy-6-polyprenyl-1,4-benzoquinol methylase
MEHPDRAPDPQPLAPHPVLPNYYARAEDRSGFVRQIFDRTAGDYDSVERLVGFGRGSRYRREALARAGIQPGMRVLDVATGTGLVAREALSLVGRAGVVIGLDPSEPMMRTGLGTTNLPLIQGSAERLPLADAQFDFVSLGFALRHVSDLHSVFREFYRVLRPGGIACVLEVTLPRTAWAQRLLKFYLGGIVPVLSRTLARHDDTPVLLRYFWDTIEACAPPAQVLEALGRAGFTAVRRHVEVHVFSEYTAQR